MMTNYSSDYQRPLQHKKQVQLRAQPHPDDVHYREDTDHVARPKWSALKRLIDVSTSFF